MVGRGPWLPSKSSSAIMARVPWGRTAAIGLRARHRREGKIMRTIMKISKVKSFALAKAKEGVTAIEYGLIAGFVALTIIAGVQLLGTTLGSFFTTMANTFSAASGGGAAGG